MDNACLKTGLCSTGIVLEPVLFEKWATNYSCSDIILVESNGVYALHLQEHPHCRQTSSSRPFSIIRLRNVSSRMNLSWIPWKNFFLHFFNWLAEKYSLSPGILPYRCLWGRSFLMTYSGIERRSTAHSTNCWLAPLPLRKKCPHVQ